MIMFRVGKDLETIFKEELKKERILTPMTSAPLFSPACPAGSPRGNVWRRMKKEGGRGESRALEEQG